MKIVHITTVHQRFDSRIFYKECITLSKNNHQITLIVADGKGNQTINNIRIIDVGKPTSRIKRLIFSNFKAIKEAWKLNADVYHFHDPELLAFIGKLSKRKKVIFDSHEDFPKLMLQREYIPELLRKSFFFVATNIEKRAYKHLFAVVCATDNIKDKFLSYGNNKVITLRNFPIITNNHPVSEEDYMKRKPLAVYVGGLTQIRGVEQMIVACQKAEIPLMLVGEFDSPKFFNDIKSLSGWQNVIYTGYLPHKDLQKKVYSKATIGLNMLLKAPNHTDSIPIKQLEYMANALPVIATNHINFCKQITTETNCGILVTPENIPQVVKAITYLKNNPLQAYQKAFSGYQAVQETYSWQQESRKLLELYSFE